MCNIVDMLAGGARLRSPVVPKPTTRQCAHCEKHGKPQAFAVKWAELLNRVFNLDARQCVRCGERMTPVAVVEDPDQIGRNLRHQGATVLERARGPHSLRHTFSLERGSTPLRACPCARAAGEMARDKGGHPFGITTRRAITMRSWLFGEVVMRRSVFQPQLVPHQ